MKKFIVVGSCYKSIPRKHSYLRAFDCAEKEWDARIDKQRIKSKERDAHPQKRFIDKSPTPDKMDDIVVSEVNMELLKIEDKKELADLQERFKDRLFVHAGFTLESGAVCTRWFSDCAFLCMEFQVNNDYVHCITDPQELACPDEWYVNGFEVEYHPHIAKCVNGLYRVLDNMLPTYFAGSF